MIILIWYKILFPPHKKPGSAKVGFLRQMEYKNLLIPKSRFVLFADIYTLFSTAAVPKDKRSEIFFLKELCKRTHLSYLGLSARGKLRFAARTAVGVDIKTFKRKIILCVYGVALAFGN